MKKEEESRNGKKDNDFFKKTLKLLEKTKDKKVQAVISILVLVFSSILVYWVSFIPRYNSASFDFLKDILYNNCKASLLSKGIDPLTADIQCENFVKNNAEKIIKQYEDFYTGPEGRYLTGIDPYYYYRLTKNLVQTGHYYEVLKKYDINADGKLEEVPYDDKQYAPPGHVMSERPPFWTVFEYYSFKIWSSLFPQWKDKLMGFIFWLPVFLAPIASIFAYLIGRRLFNDWVGLFFGIMMVFNATFLSRSFAGFADTDSLNVVLPLIALYFFILAFYERNIIKKSIFGVISAFTIGIFAWHWEGWWYIFWVILAWLGFKFMEYLFYYFKDNKHKLKDIVSLNFWIKFLKLDKVKELLAFSSAYLIASALFVTFFTSFWKFINAFLLPIRIFVSYDKPFNGFWPNTLLTVAEANDTGGFKAVIDQVFTFSSSLSFKFFAWLGVIGAIYFTYKSIKERKWERLALIFWLVAAIAYSMQGVRFLMYLGVPLAFFSAYMLYEIIRYVINYFDFDEFFRKVTKFTTLTITTLVLLALASKTFNVIHAIGEFNDNWYKTMQFIKDHDFKVITSWWDFGHYFIAMTKKMVTFDGATQVTPRAYWVGKALQSPEPLAKQIVTDLATNGDDFFNSIITYLSALELNYSKEEALKLAKVRTEDEKLNVKLWFKKHYPKDWKYLYYGTFNSTAIGVNILLKILPLNRTEAYKALINGVYLKQTNKTYKFDKEFADFLINLTHPLHPNKDAFITSQDMVGKAGAWGALGNWDFFNPPKTKAEFYARAKFYQTIPFRIVANKYVAFLPYDVNGDGIIERGEGISFIYYNNTLFANNQKVKAYIFNGTLTATQGVVWPTDLLVLVDKNRPTSLVIMSKGLINATFTRMWFMDGYGLKYFKKVYVNPSNPRIIVWSLN